MSDLSPVIVNGIGSPRAWLFTNGGEPLSDFDGQIIAKFLTKFSYTYNEEADDECSMSFMFPTLRSFDLPYFKQDVIMLVEWGYIVTDGTIIKSPRRKVAIRDLETNYKKDGIELILKCTDLVSYLKNMKTQRINKYKTVQTGSTTGYAEGDIEMNRQADLQNLFHNSLINIATVEKNKTTVVNKKGQVKIGYFNPTTKKFKPKKLEPEKNWSGGWQQRVRQDKDLVEENKGLKNLGNTTFNKALEINLKYQNDYDKVGQGPLDDADGNKIADSTDDNLELKARIFNQPIFKQFTYYGGSGELLSFKANTDTRKNKQNKTIASGIDPHTKKIVAVDVAAIDSNEITKPTAPVKSIKEGLAQAITPDSRAADADLFEAVYKAEAEALKQSYSTNDPTVKAKKVYRVEETRKDPGNIYMGYMADKKVVKMRNATEIIASPEFQDWLGKHKDPNLVGYGRGRGGQGIKKVLTGYSIETINRKYTATAEVIGDPSLIKGKVYLFNNLGRLDRGKWYAISVEHKLDMDSGYTCTLGLMKNPKPIGISAKSYSANPSFDRETGDLTLEQSIDIKESEIYLPQNQEKEFTIADIDKVQQEKQYREEDIVGNMNNRLDFLKADDDALRELTYNDEFSVEETYFEDKPKPNSHKS